MDMSMLPFSKGPPKKQKKACNNKRPTDKDRCAICGKPFSELHEVFYGKNRQNSIAWGMQIRLCEEHHRGDKGVHNDIELDLQLKRQFQHNFESLHGHKKFMEVFGKNYLEVSEIEQVREYKNRSKRDLVRQQERSGEVQRIVVDTEVRTDCRHKNTA
jgi:hypothetical protein